MFRLQKVLEWKESLERAARLERVACEQRERDLRERVTRLRLERDSLPEGTFTIAELVAWSEYADGLRVRDRRLCERLEAASREVEEKRRAHLEARREVEGLRKLRERHLERQRKVREKKQQEQLDDVANRRNVPVTGRGCRPGEFDERGIEDGDGQKYRFQTGKATQIEG